MPQGLINKLLKSKEGLSQQNGEKNESELPKIEKNEKDSELRVG